ncbi:MAG: hypothetical protein ACRDRI_06085 [Pseudonocardiaceae bacterium]
MTTAGVRAKAWAAVVARHWGLPAVKVAGNDLTRPAAQAGERGRPVLVVRLDATLVEAAQRRVLHRVGPHRGPERRVSVRPRRAPLSTAAARTGCCVRCGRRSPPGRT